MNEVPGPHRRRNRTLITEDTDSNDHVQIQHDRELEQYQQLRDEYERVAHELGELQQKYDAALQEIKALKNEQKQFNQNRNRKKKKTARFIPIVVLISLYIGFCSFYIYYSHSEEVDSFIHGIFPTPTPTPSPTPKPTPTPTSTPSPTPTARPTPTPTPTPVPSTYTGNWQIRYYVDSFGDKTNKSYISLNYLIQGTFSNTATTNSPLYVEVLYDEENGFAFEFYEYSTDHCVRYSTKQEYTFAYKTEEGKTDSITCYFSGQRLYPKRKVYTYSSDDYESFFNYMTEGGTMKFSVQPLDYSATKYSFSINMDYFSNALAKYEELNNKTSP